MRKVLILSLLLSFAYNSFAQQSSKITECVIQNGVLKDIEIDYNPATGDRSIVINGVRKKFDEVYPKSGPEYAMEQSWFTNGDSIIFNGKTFTKYGYPRILRPSEITKTGSYKGVGVYTETGSTGIVQVIYIPVRQGCEFQPYEINCTGSVMIKEVGSTASTMEFKAKATGLAGDISYEWVSKDISIIKGQGTSTVTLDLTYSKNNDEINLSVYANDAKKCPIGGYEKIYIKKPGTANTSTYSNWTAIERKEFIESCITSTKMAEAVGRAYCTCMLDKIEVKYTSPAKFEKEYKQDVIEAWAKECLPKTK